MNRMKSTCFKKCTKCGFAWPKRETFLSDPNLRMIGYQASLGELMAGLFLFNHDCGTSLAILASDFRDLYDGPIYKERLDNTQECGGHCLHKGDLGPCPAKCQCAYVREIVQVILNWPRQQQAVRQ